MMGIMERTLNERVAEEIRVQLARKNITASELARRAGMTQRSVSRRITGEKAIDMDDLERFAQALDVPVTALLPQEASIRGRDRGVSEPYLPLAGRARRAAGRPRALAVRPVHDHLSHRQPQRSHQPHGRSLSELPPTDARRPVRVIRHTPDTVA